MKNSIYIVLFATLLGVVGCTDFLTETPKGALAADEIMNAENVDGFVTAAYAALGNDHYDKPFSLWPYGSVRSDDAYKGGSGPNDIQTFHFFEISEGIRTDFDEVDGLWFQLYSAISRVNLAINALNEVDSADYPEKNERIAEMRFLRGHFYLKLKLLFKYIPYLDDKTAIDEYENISNREYTNIELWEKIAEDFEAAAADLLENNSQVGRADKAAAYAYLAKVRLYQAYEQNEEHQVININEETLTKALNAANRALEYSYTLESDFASNFKATSQNGVESIFAIQYSQDDNTMFGRLNLSDLLATPMGIGCCDFHKPSVNLARAYRTSEDGLPLFDSPQDNDFDYTDLSSDNVDSRLYHTIAVPGQPYKYNSSRIYGEDWNRSPNSYFYFASLKENVDPDGGYLVNVDPFYSNSKNKIVLRYSDLLLMKAEALVELNREAEALSIINMIRSRANSSTSSIPEVSNVSVGVYVDGDNCIWTQDFAREALRWERRLELAMEGERFFDLVRWGVASDVLNAYYVNETSVAPYYVDAKFDAGKDEYCPIPQAQINFSQGVYVQNNKY